MKNINDNSSPGGYIFKLYPLFVALFVILQIECIIFVHKQINVFKILTTISGITFPVNLLLLAIVTNCYGKQSARQLIWINNIVIIEFIIYNYFANIVDWANYENIKLINAYDILTSLFIRSGLTALIAENIAEFVFIALYNNYKNEKPKLSNSRNIFYEFIGLFKFSLFANFLMIFMSYIIIFWELSYSKVFILVLQVIFLKSIIEIILSPITIYLILKIKRFEGFDIHDVSGNNPFKFLMDYKYLNFNVTGNHENNSND